MLLAGSPNMQRQSLVMAEYRQRFDQGHVDRRDFEAYEMIHTQWIVDMMKHLRVRAVRELQAQGSAAAGASGHGPAPEGRGHAPGSAAAAAADFGRWKRRDREHEEILFTGSNTGPDANAVPQPSRFQAADQRSMYSEEPPRK